MTPTETLETIQHNLGTITNKHTTWRDPDHNIITTLQKLHHTLKEYPTTEPALILHLLQAHFVTLFDNTITNKPKNGDTAGKLSEIQEFILEQYLLTQFAIGNTSQPTNQTTVG